MPDQLLSIQDSSLQTIADKIKDKCGISRSTKIAFPGGANTPNSFVGALKGIETEVTITPKIQPQAKILTVSDTTFSISPGFHDGTGTVKIQTQEKTATPSASQQTITPDANYFLSRVLVKGIGNGYQVVTGTIQDANSTSITISGLGFTPEGIAGFLTNSGSKSGDRTAVFQSVYSTSTSNYYNLVMWSKKFWNGISTAGSDHFIFSNGSVTVNLNTSSNKFIGTYIYVVWGR